MITDNSGIPSIGLNLLRRNLAKLPSPKVYLTHRGNQQVFVVESGGTSGERFESISFSWGDPMIEEGLRIALDILMVKDPGPLDAKSDYTLL